MDYCQGACELRDYSTCCLYVPSEATESASATRIIFSKIGPKSFGNKSTIPRSIPLPLTLCTEGQWELPDIILSPKPYTVQCALPYTFTASLHATRDCAGTCGSWSFLTCP